MQTHQSRVERRIRVAQFAWFFVTTTLMALGLGFMWYMSPLGMGFAEWPTDPNERQFALMTYQISYWVGIPLLLIGQVASGILALLRRRRAAYYVPAFSFAFFIASVVLVVILID